MSEEVTPSTAIPGLSLQAWLSPGPGPAGDGPGKPGGHTQQA